MSGTPNTTGPAGPGQPAAGPRCARCGTTEYGHRGDHIDRQLRRIRPRGKRR